MRLHETALNAHINKVKTKLTEAKRPRTSATHGIAATTGIATVAILLAVLMRAPEPTNIEALQTLRLNNAINLAVMVAALWFNFSVLFDWVFCRCRASVLEGMHERLQRQAIQLSVVLAHSSTQTQAALDVSVRDLLESERDLRSLETWRSPFGGF